MLPIADEILCLDRHRFGKRFSMPAFLDLLTLDKFHNEAVFFYELIIGATLRKKQARGNALTCLLFRTARHGRYARLALLGDVGRVGVLGDAVVGGAGCHRGINRHGRGQRVDGKRGARVADHVVAGPRLQAALTDGVGAGCLGRPS